MSEILYDIRKCDHEDVDILTGMRVEFLKEAGHVKEDEDVTELYKIIYEYIMLHLNVDLHLWIVENEKKPVATGALNIWKRMPVNARNGCELKVGYFSNMYTKQEFRKKGIASCLMKKMLQFMEEEGVQKAMLHALEEGKGVYRKLGFSQNEDFMEMKLI